MVTGRNSTEGFSFSKSKSSRCHLALNIYPKAIKIGISDLVSKQHIYFNEVRINSWKDDLAPFFQYEFENAIFKKATALLFSEKNVLVPAGIYSGANEKKLFEFEFGRALNASIKSDLITSLNSYNVYQNKVVIEKVLSDSIKNLWVKHHQSVLVELLSRECKFSQQTRTYLNVREDLLDLLVFEKDKMIFCNQFAYRSAEDFVYFFLSTLEELSIQTSNAPIYLIGDIEQNDELFELLNKYSTQLNFIKNSSVYSFNSLPEISQSKEFLLFDQVLCV